MKTFFHGKKLMVEVLLPIVANGPQRYAYRWYAYPDRRQLIHKGRKP